MKKHLPIALIVPALFFLTGFSIDHQDPAESQKDPIYRAKVSFTDMVEFDRLYPDFQARGRRIKNNFERPPHVPVDLDKVVSLAPTMNAGHGLTQKDPSPVPEIDFQGLDDSGTSIPPDVNGAAGPDHLMVTLNTDVRIMDKGGAPINTVQTGAFWQGIPGAAGVFDPKISYDPYADRWIFIMCSSGNPLSTRVMVGVSETSDPTANWYLYSFDGDPNDLMFFDYPNFGFNKKWIVVSGNMVTATPQFGVLYIFNKEDLYTYAQEIEYTRLEVEEGTSLIPSVVMDEEEEDIYVVNHAGGDVSGVGYLLLRKITGDVSDPVFEEIGFSGIPYPWEEWNYFTEGDFAPQLGSDQKINTIDARYQNLVFRNNKLWCAHHIYIPVEDPSRTAIQWWELDPDGTILQWGRVDDEEEGMMYAFPTIAVNAKEDIMIGFGIFSAEQYASAGYAFRYEDDPAGTLRDPYQYKDGLAPYYKTFGGARNRWGDYTSTVVDPANDLDFWTLQEYAELPGSQDEWGVWWAKVNDEAAPLALFTANITSVPVGSGVNFFDDSKYEPDAWTWTFEGGTPETSTEQHPENIVYESAGLFDVTLVASNSQGSDTLVLEDFIDANTTILPEVDFTASDTIPCSGDVVVFEDLTVYNPVSWLWEFDPDEVTFVNGTDANSQFPEIIFDLSVPYEVTLTATNNNGSSTLTKSNYVKSGGVLLPFMEDFESWSFADRGWTIENPDESITWDIAAVEGNDPGGLAGYVNIKSYNGLDERDRLISPPMNFKNYDVISMSFQHAYSQRYSQFSDSLLIYVSSDCGNTWEKILQIGEDGSGNFATAGPMLTDFYPAVEEDWCGSVGNPQCMFIDLNPWAGLTNVQVMFETVNRYGNNLFIDNILVNAMVGAEEHDPGLTALSVYPNPTGGMLYVRDKGLKTSYDLVVYDISGHIVISRQFRDQHGSEIAIDLSSLKQGIYFLEISGDDYTGIRKVVKK
jgi:PKD repeat protein